MAKKMSILLIILIFCQFINPFINNTYAAGTLQDAFTGAQEFVTQGEAASEGTIDQSALKVASDTIYNIMLAIAFVVAMVWGIVLGIQFMIGSTEDKADIKESLLPYIIGCLAGACAFGIWKMAIEIVSRF